MPNSHYFLAYSFSLRRFRFSLSFRDRMAWDLGMTHYQLREPSKELLALSDVELIRRAGSLKAPWWDTIYEKIRKNEKYLCSLYILMNIRSYGFYAFKLLYKTLKDKR